MFKRNVTFEELRPISPFSESVVGEGAGCLRPTHLWAHHLNSINKLLVSL